MSRRLITSESVTEGHPDKIADQISDALLDAFLTQDSESRVAVETLMTTGMALVAGEVTTESFVDIPGIVRGTLLSIGYSRSDYGIDGHTCAVLTTLDQQTLDIGQGVDAGGAGDQGMMFGYASDETDALMPAPILFAHRLTKRLAEVRKEGQFSWLRPDGKAQVTMQYDGQKPVRVDTVVMSAQHDAEISQTAIRQELIDHVITPALTGDYFDPEKVTFHINPTGRFVSGGPHADCGLTGRKIIVDTYGGLGHHGGGSFSGKDATKVDRSAAYAARWAAKNVVAAGLAGRCEIQLAYAIGVAEPVSIDVETYGTGELPDGVIARALREVFDFRPLSIIKELNLKDPIFKPTAVYGHFGREPRDLKLAKGRTVRLFPWEELNRIEDLKTAAGV
ncbi:MAG: methionine adenosyltransferase [Gemmatimonadota bacterium]